MSRYFHACINNWAARELLLCRESLPAPSPRRAEQRGAVNPLCSRGCVLQQSRALRSIRGTDRIDLIAGFAFCGPFHGGVGWVFWLVGGVFFQRKGRSESGNVKRQLVLCLSCWGGWGGGCRESQPGGSLGTTD